MTPAELLRDKGMPPGELYDAIDEFWPPEEHDNALAVSYLESNWSAFAELDTTDADHPCGAFLRNVPVPSTRGTVRVTAEHSIGWFQINACNLPIDWDPRHLFNTRHNVGTAHKLWADAGNSWSPWYFSARQLGLR